MELENLLGMQSIDVYVYRRQLAWAGHVSRMGLSVFLGNLFRRGLVLIARRAEWK